MKQKLKEYFLVLMVRAFCTRKYDRTPDRRHIFYRKAIKATADVESICRDLSDILPHAGMLIKDYKEPERILQDISKIISRLNYLYRKLEIR